MSELTQRLSVALHQVRVSDANKIVGAFKNKIVSAVIVGGAIIIAIPICIFGLVRLAWVLGKFFALGQQPAVSAKVRSVAEAIEARIRGQPDKNL